jgi:hypothetical protein
MGSVPELCSDAKLLQDSPSVGVDADARAICSQAPRLLQHKTSNPFPGCVQVISSNSAYMYFFLLSETEHVQNSKLRYNDDAMISFDIGHIYTLWIDTGTEI